MVRQHPTEGVAQFFVVPYNQSLGVVFHVTDFLIQSALMPFTR